MVTKPVLAYHAMSTYALDQALLDGFISSAADKVYTHVFVEDCERRLPDIIDTMQRVGENITPDKDALKAITRLIRERSKENSSRPTYKPVTRESEFQCADFLAGDLKDVFFSLGDWAQFISPGNVSGVVFHADLLVLEEDARIREIDFIDQYTYAITNFIKTFKDGNEKGAYLWLTDVLNQVKQREIYGREAWDWLQIQGSHELQEAELVVEAPVYLDLAVEIWREGHLTKQELA